ncbi:Copper resistance protein CRF1 [Apiospora arundinis]
MVAFKLFTLAAATLVSLTSAAPAPAPAPEFAPKNATLSILSAPNWISGPWQNFPAMNTWLTFDQMFDANKNSMKSTGSTWDDIGRINVAIRNAAANIGVDERVILGIIMQESHGYVGVQTTFSPGEGIPTAGIMQCSNCPGYPGQTGLSQDQISGMVNGGTNHFKANLKDFGDKWSPESIYPALREYNSGSVNQNDLSDGMGATASYVSDIAQRLQGWVD